MLENLRKSGDEFPLDYLAFLTYAVEGQDWSGAVHLGQAGERHEREGQQAYLILKGYKGPRLPNPWYPKVVEWTLWFLQRWGPTWEKVGAWERGQFRWATVPSVRSERSERGRHPLNKIVGAILEPDDEVVLRPTGVAASREFNPAIFEADALLPGATVLLVDDLWTTGSNAFSAAAALKNAGAGVVNAMVLGRLLNTSWKPTRDFVDSGGLRRDYKDGMKPGFDVERSPWSQLK